MHVLEKINKKYQSVEKPSAANLSLISYLRSEPIFQWICELMSSGDLLELGCGVYSLFEFWDDIYQGRMTRGLHACDFSHVAIEKAKLFQNNNFINYFVHDIKNPFDQKYNCIIDAHCLHTLTSLPDLFTVMGNLKNALNDNGILVGEVMMSHKRLSFEDGLEYCSQTSVLSKNKVPSRIIMTSHEWEDFFLSCGFKIKYFMCQSSIKFIPHDNRNVILDGDPECLRFVLEKSVN